MGEADALAALMAMYAALKEDSDLRTLALNYHASTDAERQEIDTVLTSLVEQVCQSHQPDAAKRVLDVLMQDVIALSGDIQTSASFPFLARLTVALSRLLSQYPGLGLVAAEAMLQGLHVTRPREAARHYGDLEARAFVPLLSGLHRLLLTALTVHHPASYAQRIRIARSILDQLTHEPYYADLDDDLDGDEDAGVGNGQLLDESDAMMQDDPFDGDNGEGDGDTELALPNEQNEEEEEREENSSKAAAPSGMASMNLRDRMATLLPFAECLIYKLTLSLSTLLKDPKLMTLMGSSMRSKMEDLDEAAVLDAGWHVNLHLFATQVAPPSLADLHLTDVIKCYVRLLGSCENVRHRITLLHHMIALLEEDQDAKKGDSRETNKEAVTTPSTLSLLLHRVISDRLLGHLGSSSQSQTPLAPSALEGDELQALFRLAIACFGRDQRHAGDAPSSLAARQSYAFYWTFVLHLLQSASSVSSPRAARLTLDAATLTRLACLCVDLPLHPSLLSSIDYGALLKLFQAFTMDEIRAGLSGHLPPGLLDPALDALGAQDRESRKRVLLLLQIFFLREQYRSRADLVGTDPAWLRHFLLASEMDWVGKEHPSTFLPLLDCLQIAAMNERLRERPTGLATICVDMSGLFDLFACHGLVRRLPLYLTWARRHLPPHRYLLHNGTLQAAFCALLDLKTSDGPTTHVQLPALRDAQERAHVHAELEAYLVETLQVSLAVMPCRGSLVLGRVCRQLARDRPAHAPYLYAALYHPLLAHLSSLPRTLTAISALTNVYSHSVVVSNPSVQPLQLQHHDGTVMDAQGWQRGMTDFFEHLASPDPGSRASMAEMHQQLVRVLLMDESGQKEPLLAVSAFQRALSLYLQAVIFKQPLLSASNLETILHGKIEWSAPTKHTLPPHHADNLRHYLLPVFDLLREHALLQTGPVSPAWARTWHDLMQVLLKPVVFEALLSHDVSLGCSILSLWSTLLLHRFEPHHAPSERFEPHLAPSESQQSPQHAHHARHVSIVSRWTCQLRHMGLLACFLLGQRPLMGLPPPLADPRPLACQVDLLARHLKLLQGIWTANSQLAKKAHEYAEEAHGLRCVALATFVIFLVRRLAWSVTVAFHPAPASDTPFSLKLSKDEWRASLDGLDTLYPKGLALILASSRWMACLKEALGESSWGPIWTALTAKVLARPLAHVGHVDLLLAGAMLAIDPSDHFLCSLEDRKYFLRAKPCSVLHALFLLQRPSNAATLAPQPVGLLHYALYSLRATPPAHVLFYVPQLVQLLHSRKGPVVSEVTTLVQALVRQYMVETALTSPLFAHQIIWNLEANKSETNGNGHANSPLLQQQERGSDTHLAGPSEREGSIRAVSVSSGSGMLAVPVTTTSASSGGPTSPLSSTASSAGTSDPHPDALLSRLVEDIVSGLRGPELAFYAREFRFFATVTAISGALKPFVKKSRGEKKAKIDAEMALLTVDPGVYLPSSPECIVVDIDKSSGRPLQSHAKAPFMATFKVKPRSSSPEDTSLSPTSTMSSSMDKKEGEGHNEAHWQSAIFKVGDDCRQDVLALQILALMRRIYEHLGLSLFLFPYRVVATAPGCGVIEVIPGALSRDQIGREHINSLYDYFTLKYGPEGVSDGFAAARDNFVRSLAAYSIACHLLAIKDRHNGNIMIDDQGHIIHIGITFENAPFKLTAEMLQLMGGGKSPTKPPLLASAPLFAHPAALLAKLPGGPSTQPSLLPDAPAPSPLPSSPWNSGMSPSFAAFECLCTQAFLALGPFSEHLVSLASLMVPSRLPCFKSDRAIANFRARFRTDLTELESRRHVQGLIHKSYLKSTTTLYDSYQWRTNEIPY